MPASPSVDPLVRRQGGAMSRQQAVRLGFSNRSLATAVERGQLLARHPDVFVLAGASGPKTEDWAAVLAAGPAAVGSGWTAARVHGFEWDRGVGGDPCVTLPPERNIRLAGVRVLRWQLPQDDVVVLGRMRVTMPARTVVDCLRLGPRHRVERMLDTALQQRWITVDELGCQVRRLSGQRGVPMLRELFLGVTAGARSRAERVAQHVIARTGIDGWQWNCPVRLDDGGSAVLDAAIPALRIGIEIDGRAYHVDPESFQRDRTKQNRLVTQGWTVLRFTWWDLTHRPDYVVATILAAVARAA